MPPKKKNNNTLDALFESGLIKKGNDPEFIYSRIPFGIEPLDKFTGGGVPTKRFTMLRGETSTGKSFLASQLVKTVQSNGGTAAWIDAEWSWDMNWMQKCGVNIDDIIVSQPETGEKAFEICRSLMVAGTNLVVLDSLAALVPGEQAEQEAGYSPMGIQARMINNGIKLLTPNLKTGTAVVLLNQLREGIGPYAQDVAPGGNAQRFFSHLTLNVRRESWIEETVEGKKIKLGFNIEVREIKNKVGTPSYSSVLIPFKMQGGVDLMELVIDEMVEKELIKKSAGWYLFGENIKIQGRNGLKDYFNQHLDIYKSMKNETENS